MSEPRVLRPPKELRAATAYHEAGHVVMAWLQWSWVRNHGITIEPTDTYVGHCDIKRRVIPDVVRSMLASNDDRIRESARLDVECDVREDLAGPLAERRFRRIRGVYPGGTKDIERARADLALLHPDQVRLDLHWYLLEEEVRRVLRRPRCWRAVQEIAGALLREDHVSEDGAADILAEILGEPGEFLERYAKRGVSLAQRDAICKALCVEPGELLERDTAKRRGKG